MDKTFVIHTSDAWLAGFGVFFATLWLMFAWGAPWAKPRRKR